MNKQIVVLGLIIFFIWTVPNVYSQSVPEWVKNTAGWWADDAISETEFVNAIEFLINENIIHVSTDKQSQSNDNVPEWVKNTAGWWADDAISETEFVNAIEFLVKSGIINVKISLDCVSEFKEIFPNENENVLKNLCDNSEYRDELYPFPVKSNVNSYGFKGPEFSSDKPIDTYRIFLVGGSTMWGSGNYSDETTISGILQKIFDKQKLETNIEVINAGMSGANSVTEFTLIKERLVDLQPDLIIIYDGWNDLRAEYTPEMTYNNWKSMCEFGNENSFDTVITLQPIAGFGNKILTQQEHVNALTGNNHNNIQLVLHKNHYDEYANKLKELSACTKTKDLRSIFDDVSGSIFWDQGHTADAGNMIIAEKMYEILLPIIQKDLSTHKIFHDILKKYNNPTTVSYLLEQYGIERKSKTMTFELERQAGLYFELKERIGVENILVGKDLSGVDLSTMNLVGQDLTGANLSGQDLRNIDLTETILKNVDFTKANLSGLNFTGRILDGCILNETNVYQTILKIAHLSSCEILNTDFSGVAELWGTRFIDSSIINSNFSNSSLVAVVFVGSDISNTDFSNSDLSFSKAPVHTPHTIPIELTKFDISADEIMQLDRKQIDELVNKILYQHHGDTSSFLLVGFEMVDEIVNVQYLIINNFTNANLNNVDFSNADLTGAQFRGATVSSLDLSGADLYCVEHEICLGLSQP